LKLKPKIKVEKSAQPVQLSGYRL